MIIEGEHLMLISLKLDELVELDKTGNLNLKGIKQSYFMITEIQKKAINIKAVKMEKIPKTLHDWFTYWIIIDMKEMETVGLIGFKGINFLGEVEVGYGTSIHYRSKGYMTEALNLLCDWAFKHIKCRCIKAKVMSRQNLASQKVLLKNNFRKSTENAEVLSYELKRKDYKNINKKMK